MNTMIAMFCFGFCAGSLICTIGFLSDGLSERRKHRAKR